MHSSSLGTELHQSLIRDQMERILASEIFSRSERLATFLRFVVEETLAGRGDTLKEQAIAAALYDTNLRSNGYDSSVVRADARRIRDKLREYYSEADLEPVIISLPKGTYAPVFEHNNGIALAPVSPIQERPGSGSSAARPARARGLGIAIPVWAAMVVIGVAWWMSRSTPPSPTPRIVSLTQYPGGESDPSFSPDGNFVAFAWWSPPGPAPQDIWIKAVKGEAMRRLTDTPSPVAEHSPAWSPDGKDIAFERVGWAGQAIPNAGIFVVSMLGGLERRISESGRNPKWTSDGRSVLVVDGNPPGIVRIDLTTLRREQITQAPRGEAIGKFDVSPDGATLAFIRSRRSGVSDIYLVPINGGAPKQLTNRGALMEGLAWTPDGRDIVYDVGGESLWRISAKASSPGRAKPIPGLEGLVTSAARALKPVIAPAGPRWPARLAFQVQKADVNLRLIDLDAPLTGDMLQVKAPLDSSRIDMPGYFSPDGAKIAFFSLWGFPAPLWVAQRDGSAVRQIVSMEAPFLKVGGWSPDGRWIAFDSAVQGNSDIYLVAETGGEPKRLTTDPAVEVSPSWSQDGRWIYYSSNRTGRPEVWRMTASGASPVRVTRNGGTEPAESADGKYLYYLDPASTGNGTLATARLKMSTTEGAQEQVVLDAVKRGLWGLTARGIYFLTQDGNFEAIDLYRPPDATVTRIGRMPFRVPPAFPRMTFSRDGRWLLTNQVDRRESDLLMIEGFR